MRIIGIRILEGDSLVLKNLKPGWYPFGEYQEPTEENDYIWQTKEGEKADEWLNRLYQSVAEDPFAGNMKLSVNCIVGANGSGKSTLLELMLRIINNISVCLIDEQWMPKNGKHKAQMGHDMTMANGFAAELLYEVNGNLYGIISNNINGLNIEGRTRNYAIMKYTKAKETTDNKPSVKSITPWMKRMTTKRLKNVLGSLFYTIYTNYSIYSLNEEDYGSQQLISDNYAKNLTGDWIHGLLHKNDGYLAPAVMIPFREKNGIINIQTEKRLSKQRLSALALLFESQKKTFLDGYKPYKISYIFRDDSENDYKERFMKDSSMIVFLYGNKEDCQSSLWDNLKKAWEVKIAQYAESYHDLIIQSALSYLAYKTLKVCMQHRELGEELGLKTREELNLEKDPVYAFNDLFLEKPPKMNIVDVICEENEVSHVTLKIHQTLEFLRRNIYKVHNPEAGVMGEAVFSEEEMTIKDCIDLNLKYLNDQVGNGEKGIKRFETYDDAMLSLPPSFIEWEISFTKSGESGPITLDSMSSGQKQMLQCFSYIMYHLKNLQSVKDGEYHAKYHHVNLVFDEAELYYHPEFQRSIIRDLIRMLSWCHIDGRKIRSINMIIVTHSPFVLSDVPRQNCLFLNDGNVEHPKNETFGANIHDLLYSNFFIKDYMGSIARKAVDDIVKLKNMNDKNGVTQEMKEEDVEYFSYLASTIAEPYIRKQLMAIVEKVKKPSSLEIARQKRKALENQLEAINKEISILEQENDK